MPKINSVKITQTRPGFYQGQIQAIHHCKKGHCVQELFSKLGPRKAREPKLAHPGMKAHVLVLLWTERRYPDSLATIPQAGTSKGWLRSCRNLTLLSNTLSPLAFLRICWVPSGEDCAAGMQPCCPSPAPHGRGWKKGWDCPRQMEIAQEAQTQHVDAVWQEAWTEADFCWPQPCRTTLLS